MSGGVGCKRPEASTRISESRPSPGGFCAENARVQPLAALRGTRMFRRSLQAIAHKRCEAD
eukprot:6139464-Prorocentrum_lima.AAC.1